MLVICSLMAMGAALAASWFQEPVYEATASVLFQPRAAISVLDPGSGQRDPTRDLNTQIRVLQSEPLRAAVRAKLGTAPEVSASPVPDTDVIQIQARDGDPARAAAVANTYVEVFVTFRREQTVNDLLEAGQEVQRRIDDLQKQIDEVSEKIAAVPPCPGAGATAGGGGPCPQTVANQGLSSRRDAHVSQQTILRQRLDQLQLAAAFKTGEIQLVTPAIAPRSPVEPDPLRNAALGLAAGLLLGLALAFLSEYLSESIESKEDLDRVSHGLPVLGLIPQVTTWKSRTDTVLVSVTSPHSPAAEAYRSLRTSIRFADLDGSHNVILVTSPSASEGKTTTVANLGLACARAGQRVILVDCDLRRPRLHRFFDMANDVGLTSAVLGDLPISQVVQRIPDADGLLLLPSGPVPSSPAELLSTGRIPQLLKALKSHADLVLLDCPPAVPVTDAALLSEWVDATLVVVTARVTRRRDVSRALEVLRQGGAPLTGLVLNGVGGRSSYGYSYYGNSDDLAARRSGRAARATNSSSERRPRG